MLKMLALSIILLSGCAAPDAIRVTYKPCVVIYEDIDGVHVNTHNGTKLTPVVVIENGKDMYIKCSPFGGGK